MPAMKMNHTEWQGQVVDLANLLGWRHLHVRRTKGKGGHWTTSTNRTGWPDLFLWHPRHGFAAIELKVKPDLPTIDQVDVLAELGSAGDHPARTCVAYPDDFDGVQDMLRGRTMGWEYRGATRS